MANTETYSGPPAQFQAFLSKQGKALYSRELQNEFADFEKRYEALNRDLEKYSRPQAEKQAREVQARAEADPTEANLNALAENTPADVARRFEHVSNVLHNQLNELCKRFAPCVQRIASAALALVDGEIARVQAEGHEIAARYGVPYSPENDATVKALRKWRDMAVNRTRTDTARPIHPPGVRETFGRIKQGLLG